MDRVDYNELTDATLTAPETVPFWPRLRRAVVMLMAAIALHVWLIRAPQVAGPGSNLLADGVSSVVPTALANPPTLASDREADHGQPTQAARVQVRTEFINITPFGRGPASEREGGRILPELPVGTSGFLRAAAEIPVTTSPTVALPFVEHTSPAPVPASSIAEVRPTLLGAPAPINAAASVGPSTSSTSSSSTSSPPAAPPALRDAPAVSTELAAVVGDRPAELRNADLKKAELRKQEETVRRVLQDYRRAYEELDVRAAKALWPSVDERALEKAFRQIQTQQVRLGDCGVSVSGQGANARCQVDATYRPKVGSRVVRLPAGLWTFNLARDNDRWQIVNASLQ
jgi:hypothetical protein